MKKLITIRNINDYLAEGEKEFYVDKTMIISPGAKDFLRNKGIVIVYGNKEENCSKEINECKEVSNLDVNEEREKQLKIVKTISNLLVQEFNVTDAQAIEEITSKVLSKIEK